MTEKSEAKKDQVHLEKMKKRKTSHEKKLAASTGEKGLIIVNTGPGKGKSTAAFGMILRCVGHGMKAGLVQFIKGAQETGEQFALTQLSPPVVHKIMGEGFTWDTQDRQRDMEKAREGWNAAKEMINDPSFKLIVLDELNVVLRYDYLPVDEVVAFLSQKREDLHVVVTGRNAPKELIEIADTVSEIKPVKHAFKSGIKAQKGVEF